MGTKIVPLKKHGLTIDGMTFRGCPDCYTPPSVEERLSKAGVVAPTDFTGFRDVPEMRESLQACRDLVDGKRWVVFMRGGPGRGKTHLAKGAARGFVERNRTVFFRKVPRLLDELRDTYSRVSREKDDENRAQMQHSLTGLLDFMAHVDLLILDDFGAQANTDWARDKLYQIIDDRYEAKRALIVTTNVLPRDERADERLLDRLAPGAIVIKGGESRRREYDG